MGFQGRSCSSMMGAETGPSLAQLGENLLGELISGLMLCNIAGDDGQPILSRGITWGARRSQEYPASFNAPHSKYSHQRFSHTIHDTVRRYRGKEVLCKGQRPPLFITIEGNLHDHSCDWIWHGLDSFWMQAISRFRDSYIKKLGKIKQSKYRGFL